MEKKASCSPKVLGEKRKLRRHCSGPSLEGDIRYVLKFGLRLSIVHQRLKQAVSFPILS